MKRFSLCILAVASTLLSAPDTFSPDRFRSFFNDYVYDQAVIVNTALGLPLPPTRFASPAGLLNHVPLVITNNTGIDSSRIYVIGKGETLEATDAYFLKPELKTGICTLVLPFNPVTADQMYSSADPTISVKLSELPATGPNSYLIYVPQMISGRFYLSIDTPLFMETLISGGLQTINDPSQTTVQDPNYYTLYQDFEFTLDKNYDLFANVTNVDYFAMPLTLASHTYPSNNLFPTIDNLTVVGYPTTSTRSAILSAIQTGLLNDASNPPQWSSLSVPFYTNPYAVSSPATYLRILAAKHGISLGQNGVQFVGGANSQSFFNPLYLESTTSGPSGTQSYYQNLYSYYGTNSLDLIIFPADNPKTIYNLVSGTAGTISGTLNLNLGTPSGAAPNQIQVNLDNLSTEALLGGDVGVWVQEDAISPTNTDPWQTEIAKILSALFSAGFLPPSGTISQPVISDSSYFSTYRDSFFNNPPGFTQHGPWYNLYDQVIHPLLIQTGGFGLGYAYDFDDLLDLAGLLHVNIQTNGALNPNQPYVVLTSGPIDTVIPDITEDFGPYSLTVTQLTTGSNPIDILYSQDPTQAPNQSGSVPIGGASPLNLTDLQNYFIVKYYTDGSKTSSLDYNVYPKYQLALPSTTRYNSQDVVLINGIVFNSASSSSFQISLPYTNPFPPAPSF